MRVRKTILVNILLAVILTLSSMAAPVFAQPSDVTGHWASAQINNWLEKGLIRGYEDDSFKPDHNMTRAEFVAVLNRALGLTARKAVVFSDVSANAWYAEDVEKAQAAGYISGYEDNTFRPDNLITRVEVAKILSTVLKLKNHEDVTKLNGYQDAGNIPQWGKESLNSAVAEKYFQGYPDNTIRPLNNISRAEAVTVLYQALGTVYNAAGIYGPEKDATTIKGNVTVSSAGVNIRNTKIEGDLILAAGIGDGKVQLDNVIVAGRTLISGGGAHSIIIRNSNLNEVLVDKDLGETPRIVTEGTSAADAGTEGEGYSPTENPPQLMADITGNDGAQEINLSFVDDPDWRAAIDDITVNFTSIAGRYSVHPGNIMIDADVFAEASKHMIIVKAAGYLDATVVQSIQRGGLVSNPGTGQGSDEIHYNFDSINLKSVVFRNYLSGDWGLTVCPVKLKQQAGDERWRIINANNPNSGQAVRYNDIVYLKSDEWWGNYLTWQSSGDNAGVKLVRQPPSAWVIKDSRNPDSTAAVKRGDTVYLQSVDWGNYLSGQGSGDNAKVEMSQNPGAFERWFIEPAGYIPQPVAAEAEVHFGDIVNIKSKKFRNHVSGTGGKVQLRQHPGELEQWKIINPDQPDSTGVVKFHDQVHLQSVNGGNYISEHCYTYPGLPEPDRYKYVVELNDGAAQLETWRFINAADYDSVATVKPGDAVLLQSVNWVNYLSGKGSGNNAGVQVVTSPQDGDSWYIVPKDYFRNWMSLTPEIVNKPLKEITFPATHDTGTWAFEDEIAPEDTNTQLISDALTTVDSIIDEVDQIGFLDITHNQLQQMKNAAYDVVYDAIKDLAKCHDYTIAQQLDAGIRWFDLRMYLADDGAYTHHFLKGVDMDTQLDAIKSFIEGTKGEILVLEMSHFVGDGSKYKDFADQLRTKLGPYAVRKEADANGNINPFNKTYREIMGDNPMTSMVILNMDGWEDVTDDPIFWGNSQLGRKYNTYGYSNKTTAQEMIDDQLEKFNEAKQNGDLFTLWYTLTCDPDDSTKIVSTRMVEELADVLLPIVDTAIDEMLSDAGESNTTYMLACTESLYAWFWDDIVDGYEDVADGIGDIVDGIESGYNTIEDLIDFLKNHPEIPNPKDILKEAARKKLEEIIASLLAKGDCGYRSVKDLSDRVNPGLQTTLEQKFQSFEGGQTSGNNKITVFYADFFENSLLVETAIRYSRLP